MSYCRNEGKDKILFLSEEEASKASTVELTSNASDVRKGLITEDGEINWNCPCLGGMPTGPCGVPFRQAFSCFHFRLV